MIEYHGMRVVESPAIQRLAKIRLSDDFEWISPEARAHFNGLWLERFGTYEPSYIVDNSAMQLVSTGASGQTLVVGPEGMRAILTQIKAA